MPGYANYTIVTQTRKGAVIEVLFAEYTENYHKIPEDLFQKLVKICKEHSLFFDRNNLSWKRFFFITQDKHYQDNWKKVQDIAIEIAESLEKETNIKTCIGPNYRDQYKNTIQFKTSPHYISIDEWRKLRDNRYYNKICCGKPMKKEPGNEWCLTVFRCETCEIAFSVPNELEGKK